MMRKTFAVWDLGATKCAAAIVHFDIHTDQLECVKSCRIPLASCASLDELVEQVETALSYQMKDADAICIAAAGRYNGERVELEAGYPYAMDFSRVARQCGWRNMEVVHDYVPVACATFTSYLKQANNTKTIIKGNRDKFGRRVVLGLGTGLGLKDAVLLPNGDFWLGSNEAGHIGLSFPPNAKDQNEKRHREFVTFLRQEGGLESGEVLTYEKILSGKGLSRIHHFLSGNQGVKPEAISGGMSSGEMKETLSMLAWYLGLYIGTVQLVFMPSGGIWMTGGVLLKNMALCEQTELMEGIQASPAYLDDRQHFPLNVMCGQDYALMGCAYYASRRMLYLPSHMDFSGQAPKHIAAY
jgi:glucokinase